MDEHGVSPTELVYQSKLVFLQVVLPSARTTVGDQLNIQTRGINTDQVEYIVDKKQEPPSNGHGRPAGTATSVGAIATIDMMQSTSSRVYTVHNISCYPWLNYTVLLTSSSTLLLVREHVTLFSTALVRSSRLASNIDPRLSHWPRLRSNGHRRVLWVSSAQEEG